MKSQIHKGNFLSSDAEKPVTSHNDNFGGWNLKMCLSKTRIVEGDSWEWHDEGICKAARPFSKSVIFVQPPNIPRISPELLVQNSCYVMAAFEWVLVRAFALFTSDLDYIRPKLQSKASHGNIKGWQSNHCHTCEVSAAQCLWAPAIDSAWLYPRLLCSWLVDRFKDNTHALNHPRIPVPRQPRLCSLGPDATFQLCTSSACLSG